MNDRFLVAHHAEGLIDSAATRADAMTIANRWAASVTGYSDAAEVRIFDRMARFGTPCEWNLQGHVVATRNESANS